MAVKTITIDLEAYDALAARKRPGESFSRVIKRTFADERYTASNLLDHLDSIMFSAETLDAVEEVIQGRSRDLVAEPDQHFQV